MTIAASLLPEFDVEMASTRRILERTPETDAGWRPHAKSFTLGELAQHIATLPGWGAMTLRESELDLSPPGGEPYRTPPFTSLANLLATFDQSSRAGREALAAAPDSAFAAPWSLKNAGAIIFTMPRIAVYRSFVMSHLIHHRGQFSVYLRLRDVPLPSLYGPTADATM